MYVNLSCNEIGPWSHSTISQAPPLYWLGSTLLTSSTMGLALLVISTLVGLASAMTLLARDLSNVGPVLHARQAISGLNLTALPSSCLPQCATIDGIIIACVGDPVCRCTHRNALLLEYCIECVVQNVIDTDPEIVTLGQAIITEFAVACANDSLPVGPIGPASRTAIAPPLSTLQLGPGDRPTSNPVRKHTINKAAIAGGISGGLVVLAICIWYLLLRRKSFKNVAVATKQRPFYRLNEVEAGASPGLVSEKV